MRITVYLAAYRKLVRASNRQHNERQHDTARYNERRAERLSDHAYVMRQIKHGEK